MKALDFLLVTDLDIIRKAEEKDSKWSVKNIIFDESKKMKHL
jgi:hypothetical protein